MLGIHRNDCRGRQAAAESRPRHHNSRRRPTVEPLEGRALLSLTTWTVNNLGDAATVPVTRATCGTASPRPTRTTAPT